MTKSRTFIDELRWKNPTGNLPDSAALWGGATPEVTFTTPGTNNVDTGNYIGIHSFVKTDGTTGDIRMDDYYAGSL